MEIRKLNEKEVIKNMLELALYLHDNGKNDEIEVEIHGVKMCFSLEVINEDYN